MMRKRSGFGWMELIMGILLIVAGIFALVRPGSVLTGLVFLYGLLAVLTGVADLVFYVKMERHMGFGPTISLITGILSLMTGLILLLHPGAGRWAMALLFPLWFITHCLSQLAHLPVVRMMAGNNAYLFSLILNILGLILGFMLLLFPEFSLLSLGWVIGLYLILLGIDSIIMAFSNVGGDW